MNIRTSDGYHDIPELAPVIAPSDTSICPPARLVRSGGEMRSPWRLQAAAALLPYVRAAATRP